MLRFLLFPHFSNVTWQKVQISNIALMMSQKSVRYHPKISNFNSFLAGEIVGIADLWSEMHAKLRKKCSKV